MSKTIDQLEQGYLDARAAYAAEVAATYAAARAARVSAAYGINAASDRADAALKLWQDALKEEKK